MKQFKCPSLVLTIPLLVYVFSSKVFPEMVGEVGNVELCQFDARGFRGLDPGDQTNGN